MFKCHLSPRNRQEYLAPSFYRVYAAGYNISNAILIEDCIAFQQNLHFVADIFSFHQNEKFLADDHVDYILNSNW